MTRNCRSGSTLVVLAAAALFSIRCSGGPDVPAQPAEDAQPTGEVRLYVADRYESVRQLAPDTLETVATVDVGLRPHGLVASPDRRTLYVTVETTDELVQVDLATNAILGRAHVGAVPNEPTITHDGRYVFVPSRGGDQCAVVDTETMQVVKEIAAGTAEHNAYTSADGRWVFVTSMGDDMVTVVDAATLEIDRQISLGGVPRPMALTADLSTAYVALSGLTGFITLDLHTDTVVDRLEIPIPEDTPVPPLDTYTHGLQLSPDERELWVAAYGSNKIHAFSLPERHHFAEIDVPGHPHWFALHPDGEPLYVTLESSGQVAAIHRGLREVIRIAKVGAGPTRMIAVRVPDE